MSWRVLIALTDSSREMTVVWRLFFGQTPAGDVPIRSVTLASDGSCLVAGNNKVSDSDLYSVVR